MHDSQQLKDQYQSVMARAGEAATRAGRRPDDVLVVAVTKYASIDMMAQVIELGHRDLGESRVPQLIDRASEIESKVGPVASELRWHMIGHLQRNKAKAVSKVARLIHSVDSLRLAEELHSIGNKRDEVIDVLLQVNTSGEESKFGAPTPAVIPLCEQIDTMLHLRLRGLMTMAPHVDNPEATREVFARTRELFQDVKDSAANTAHLNILSMGMSNDFEVAIEEGANMVRVGTAIFGETEHG